MKVTLSMLAPAFLKNLQQLIALQADSDVSMLRVTQFLNVPAKKRIILLGSWCFSDQRSAHLIGSNSW